MSDFDPERSIYVQIQDSVGPLDRGDKYEDELQELLRERALGEIIGGGRSSARTIRMAFPRSRSAGWTEGGSERFGSAMIVGWRSSPWGTA